MKSQWECYLQNLGEWQGSFTLLSPQGEQRDDTPSLLRLEGLDQNQKVRLTLQRQSQADVVLEFTSVGGGLKFFETGSFSQGTIQVAPFTEFGAELGLTQTNRRLRLVQIFNPTGELDRLTLIREQRRGTDAPERPPLTLDQLLGEWKGNAVTLYADLRSPVTYPTNLQIRRDGDTQLVQQLSFGDGSQSQTITSIASIEGSKLQFNQGPLPVQVLLLPDGASSTCPTCIKAGQPFFLEAGWLHQPNERQRLIRNYSDKGEWISLTLVTEHRAN